MHPKTTIYLSSAVLGFGLFAYFFLGPPTQFPVGSTVQVEKGWSLGKVATVLKDSNIIRSPTVFKFFVIATGGEKRIRPAFYNFTDRAPVFEVAWRVSGGRFYLAPVRVTIPEGFTTAEIAETFSEKLPDFDKEEFIALAADKEGQLFPDTYFFLNTDGAEQLLLALAETHEDKISSL